jgi:redox-sensitive bicupin YhaK (pirin superfamily)
MIIPHEAAHRAGWRLQAGVVRSLPAALAPQLLLVLCGRVWITEHIGSGECRVAVDHWLVAGQTLALPEGSRWIVEADQDARLLLLASPPPTISRAASWRGAWACLRRAWHALTARPAAPAAPTAA